MLKNDCLFCRIIKGELPAQKIFENEFVMGIKDIAPITPIHYLFIPKVHLTSLSEVADFSILSHLHKALVEVAGREGVLEKGYRSVINTGEEGGQTVFHLHLHLLAGKKLSARIN
jgi:histidine triad (HIT) family protein